jgi:hypothetical protein
MDALHCCTVTYSQVNLNLKLSMRGSAHPSDWQTYPFSLLLQASQAHTTCSNLRFQHYSLQSLVVQTQPTVNKFNFWTCHLVKGLLSFQVESARACGIYLQEVTWSCITVGNVTANATTSPGSNPCDPEAALASRLRQWPLHARAMVPMENM